MVVCRERLLLMWEMLFNLVMINGNMFLTISISSNNFR